MHRVFSISAFVFLISGSIPAFADSPEKMPTTAPLRGMQGTTQSQPSTQQSSVPTGSSTTSTTSTSASSTSTASPSATSTAPTLTGQTSTAPSPTSPSPTSPTTSTSTSNPANVTETPVPYPTESTRAPSANSSSANSADSLPAPASYSPINTHIPTRPLTVQGSAKFTLTASAVVLDHPPLMRCRDENLQFVRIDLKNDTDQVALVHGDIAEAKIGPNMRTAASARYIGTVASPKLGLVGRIATGWVEAGTLGLAGPIFYENITPQQHRKRYLGTAIGPDGSRHEIEDERFGLRVLMPGEETVGWLAFECPDPTQLSNLMIPVNYSQSALPSGSLIVPIQHPPADGGSAGSKPSAQIEVAPLVTPTFGLRPAGASAQPETGSNTADPNKAPSATPGLNAPPQQPNMPSPQQGLSQPVLR